jgi:hypothetical protein
LESKQIRKEGQRQGGREKMYKKRRKGDGKVAEKNECRPVNLTVPIC